MYFYECLKFYFIRRGSHPNLTYWNNFDRKKSRIFTIKGCVSLRINLSQMPSTTNPNKNKLCESWRKVSKEKWQGTEKMPRMEQFIHIMKEERMPKLQDLVLKRQDFLKIQSKVTFSFHYFTIFLTIWRLDLKNNNVY